MNPFEYAMQMETDGRKYYEEQAAAISDNALQRIFTELAHDEMRHYEVFKAMSHGDKADMGAFKTNILTTTRNIFQELKDKGESMAEYSSDAREAWAKALGIEDKSEKFYREQAQKSESDEMKNTWNTIADEEHKHWVAIHNVIEFLDRPREYLEDAEWSQLGE